MDPFTFGGAIGGLLLLAVIVVAAVAALWVLVWCYGLLGALLQTVAWLVRGRRGRCPLREFLRSGP